jgi:peptidoglycan/xylan/chitin deacetylase (PgdA/CDA1 family)
MQPAAYGPFPYLPIVDRTRFKWPGGARLALWVIPNIEFFRLDDVMPGTNNERVAREHARIPNMRNWSLRDYGNRVGVWRFMDMLSRHGIRGTVALNSIVCEHHPQIIEKASALGWEFMGHSQTNTVRINEMPPEKERAAIQATLAQIAKATGKRPRGWLGPGLAETWDTLDILRSEGVDYVCDFVSDDLPFRMTLDGGTMFSIPYTLQCNDTPQFFDQKLSAEEFGQLIRNQFDWLYKEAADIPRVMAIALHPFVSGQPNRIGAVDKALDYICSHEGVWRATGSEIIDHYAQAVPHQ